MVDKTNDDHGGKVDATTVLSSIVNYSDDAIITRTLGGIITTWNRGAEKMFGYASEEIIGKHISLLTPPDRLDEEPEISNKITRGETVDHYETERRRKDGSIVDISLVVSATRDTKGNIRGILKIARDITFRKKAEEIQSRMADIINLSDDGIYSKNLEGIITSWNKGAEKLYGYEKHEVIGKNVTILIPPGKADESPMIIRKVSSGELIEHYETERVKKNGTIAHVSLSVSPIKASGGKVTGVLIVARDVTLRKQAEQLHTWLAAIINFSDDAIISKDLNGIITSWNAGAEKIFGWKAREVIGKPITILIPDARLDEEPEILSKVSAGKYIQHYETERIRKDGSVVQISLTVSPIKDGEGKVVGISKIARDITEQKKRLQEIMLLNQELEAFNYSVAHDLRSPVRLVGFTAEILLQKHSMLLPPDGQQLLQRILRQSQRMDALIKDLLSLSQSGRQDLRTSLVDMQTLVDETLHDLRASQVELNADISVGKLEPIVGDRSLLKQVWENLITNAIKYRKDERRAVIEVGCSAVPHEVIYFVKDNGVGFDMQYVDKLFKAFQRLHNRSEFEGTGVGLAIVNQVISRHGGRAWAESQKNQGSTFFFSLPRTLLP